MNTQHHAAVLLIGDELLSGTIGDKNLAFIAQQLATIGMRIDEARIVPDNKDAIIQAINALRVCYDFVFSTGGIGPTHDDITTKSIACAFGVDVIQHEQIAQLLQQFYQKKQHFPKAALKMAQTPQGAILHYHTKDALPFYQIDNVFVMAGVPGIMQKSLKYLIPKLPKTPPCEQHYVHANINESEIADYLSALENQHLDLTIGSYPQEKNSAFSEYQTVFILKSTDTQVLKIATQQLTQTLQAKNITISFT